MTFNVPQKKKWSKSHHNAFNNYVLKCVAAVFFLAHLVVEELGP